MSAPAWALGLPLDWLGEIAGLFREEFKPHSYGAFGIPKERDVATARAADQLMWTGKPPAGAAIFRLVKQATKHEDFAGHVATMQPGDLFVRSIAGAAKEKLLAHMLEAGPAAMWVEGHVENAGLAALLGELGFSRVMTKVSASSDLKGLWCNAMIEGRRTRWPSGFVAADQVAVKVLAPDFMTEAERGAILGELEEHAAWAQHYSGYNKGRSWTAFALKGYDPADPGFIIKPSEMSKAWKEEHAPRLAVGCGLTLAAKWFPTVWEVLARIPADFQRVRFMRLSAAGGELTRHADITDPEAGTADGRIARLHMPLVSAEACVFRVWGLDGKERRLHMPERSLAYLDTRKPHAVINPAEIERIHLVADAYSTPELRRLIE